MASGADLSEFNFEDYADNLGVDETDKKFVQGGRGEWFKGEKSRVYRVAFMYFRPLVLSLRQALAARNQLTDEALGKVYEAKLRERAEKWGVPFESLEPSDKLDMTTINFKQHMAYYKEGVGYAVPPKDLSTSDQAVWARLGESRRYLSTLLLVYPADASGDVDVEALTLKSCRILPFRLFAGELYETFITKQKKMKGDGSSLSSRDLELTCTNSSYQNFKVEDMKSAWLQKPIDFRRALLKAAYAKYTDKVLDPFPVRSTDYIREKLGIKIDSDDSDDASVSDGSIDDALMNM